MAEVTVALPSQDEINEALRPMIEAALSVVDDVSRIVKDRAILDNEDVDGNQMHPKKPRPKNNPQNFPNLPLIQNTSPDLMNNDRFTVTDLEETAGVYSRSMIYDPPEHLTYLLQKDPEHGGRPWIKTDGTINATAQQEIEDEMAKRLKGD